MEKGLVRETTNKIGRINRTIMRMIDRKVSSTHIFRGQHQVLMHVANHSNAMQAELAECMGISPSALAVSLKKLEKGGYIKRSSDTLDERKKHIEITELGSRIVTESNKMFQELEEQIFLGFSEEELRELCSFMDRIAENLTVQQNCSKEEG